MPLSFVFGHDGYVVCSMVDERCLSVVMPCFNERTTIEAIVERVLASPFTSELVVVDDGSTDGTRELLHKLAKGDDRIRVFEQNPNRGKGAALRMGFANATAPFVIIQDADLEYDPGEYQLMLEPLIDGRADVVFGSRFQGHSAHRVLYFWHSVGNKVLTLFSNMLTDLNLSDMETCFKAFRREVLESITLQEDRFGFEPEITAKVAAGPWRIFEVGISYSGRTYSEGKKIGWKDGVRALWCIVKYARRPTYAGVRGQPR
jgi:glycosyltransferase involved in cell wall biosynthesis